MVKRVLGSLDYIQQILFTVKLLNAQVLAYFVLSNNHNPTYITHQGSPAVMKEFWFIFNMSIFQVRLSYMLLRTI